MTKKKQKIKLKQIYSDNEVDQGFADQKKNRLLIVLKKEQKHHELLMEQMNAQIFGDFTLPVEWYNNRHLFVENSLGEENVDQEKKN